MKKRIYLFVGLFALMSLLTVSCSKSDEKEKEIDPVDIIGNWALWQYDEEYYEDGRLIETESVAHDGSYQETYFPDGTGKDNDNTRYSTFTWVIINHQLMLTNARDELWIWEIVELNEKSMVLSLISEWTTPDGRECKEIDTKYYVKK